MITEDKLRRIIREELNEVYNPYQKHVGKKIDNIQIDVGGPRDPYEYLNIGFKDGTTMTVSGKEITA
mgnify:CR=1 FL=1